MSIWEEPRLDPKGVENLVSALGIQRLTARILVSRGLKNPDEAMRFLSHRDRLLPPEQLPGLEDAVKHVLSWIRKGETICVYADYDVDGASSAAILCGAIQEAGGKVVFYQPDRFTEGYGVHDSALARAHAKGFRRFITVDTGIKDTDAIRKANARGQTVIVLDHHEPPEREEDLPPALVVVDPKIKSRPYPFDGLCAAGISYKFAQLLIGNEAAEKYIELAALATVADVVPLVSENRVLVHQGLQRMVRSQWPGITALKEVSGLGPEAEVTARHIGFVLGPRINALGRMKNPRPGALLLMTRFPADLERLPPDEQEKVRDEVYRKALLLAHQADEANDLRRKTQDGVVKDALAQLATLPDDEKAYFVVTAGPGWHQGVVGIAAAKVVEATNRPAICLSVNGELAVGSARSVPAVNVYEALCACSDLLIKFGGHPAAAGLTIRTENIPEFRRRLNAYVREHVGEEGLIPRIVLDAWANLDEITVESVRELASFEPCGHGNPKPLVGVRNVKVIESRRVGSDLSTLKAAIMDERTGCKLGVVSFGYFKQYSAAPGVGDVIDVVGELGLNTWKDQTSPQMELVDWRPCGGIRLKLLPRELL